MPSAAVPSAAVPGAIATRFQPTADTVGATISDEGSGEWCTLPCTLQLLPGKHELTVVGAQNAFVFTKSLTAKRPATYSVQKGTRGLKPLGIVTLSVGGAAALVGFMALIGGPGGGGSSNPAVGLPLLIGGAIAIPGGIVLILNGRNRFSRESYDVASTTPLLTFQHNW